MAKIHFNTIADLIFCRKRPDANLSSFVTLMGIYSVIFQTANE
jgi:hypothetical protein